MNRFHNILLSFGFLVLCFLFCACASATYPPTMSIQKNQWVTFDKNAPITVTSNYHEFTRLMEEKLLSLGYNLVSIQAAMPKQKMDFNTQEDLYHSSGSVELYKSKEIKAVYLIQFHYKVRTIPWTWDIPATRYEITGLIRHLKTGKIVKSFYLDSHESTMRETFQQFFNQLGTP